MTDQTGDRPEGRPERRLPARRPPSDTVPSRSADRFTSPRQVRNIHGLTSERAAKIVRQTADARWVAFLGVVIVALFVIIYYFYELGVPIINTTPRLEAEGKLQQVTSVERGYNLYEANCARCHGVNGEGGIGPILNDQSKLFSHLTESYIRNVLTVGGRYVCGDPKSVMPVWANTNGGPLNYIAIDDLIAFIRAPSTQAYTRRDPEFNEPILGADGKVLMFKGWRDEAFKPEPSATAVPDCYKGTAGGATAAPPASLPPDATVLELTAVDVEFDKHELSAPAGKVFAVDFTNDGSLEHDMDIRLAAGQPTLVDDPKITNGATQFVIGPLEAGTYNFFCSVHDIPGMNGTLTVK
ncbi:MAG TPA: cupredoxin domain-containing protein [Candidatus Limnocylindrales bacterium]|jgi:mono/diheme cytochrome c family protein/plastocyanin